MSFWRYVQRKRLTTRILRKLYLDTVQGFAEMLVYLNSDPEFNEDLNVFRMKTLVLSVRRRVYETFQRKLHALYNSVEPRRYVPFGVYRPKVEATAFPQCGGVIRLSSDLLKNVLDNRTKSLRNHRQPRRRISRLRKATMESENTKSAFENPSNGNWMHSHCYNLLTCMFYYDAMFQCNL